MLYSLLVFVYLSLSAVFQCAAASWTAWWELLLLPKAHTLGLALRAWAKLIPLSPMSLCFPLSLCYKLGMGISDCRRYQNDYFWELKIGKEGQVNWEKTEFKTKVYSRSEKDFLGGGMIVIGLVFEKVWNKKMKHSSKKKVYLVSLIKFSAIFFSQVWAHLTMAWDFSCVYFSLQF